MKKTRLDDKGQTLIEVLIALLIVTLVLTAVVSSVILSIKSAQYSRNKSRGVFLAQEAIEWIRVQRLELGWTDFFGYGTVSGAQYCLVTLDSPPFLNTGVCDQAELIDGTFSRQVTLIQDAVDPELTANVEVVWNEGNRTFDSQVSATFAQRDLVN